VMRAMARLSPLLRTHDGAYVPVPMDEVAYSAVFILVRFCRRRERVEER
jgi:hypothetical protein